MPTADQPAVIPPAAVDQVFSFDVVVGAGVPPIENPYLRPLPPPAPPPPRPRRVRLPVILFCLTCLSTFWAGALGIDGFKQLGNVDLSLLIGKLAADWWNGLSYMAAVMAILLAHEMGHFLQALRYRIPASLPFFIPMPITPIGTMGAVIGMQGSRADRKALFDIGVSGPLAGLVLAVPIAWYGIVSAPVQNQPSEFQNPLLLQMMVHYLRPELQAGQYLTVETFYLAGWVGMLITGLNMLPVSLLDGGHVSYALFGRGAHWLARAMVLAALVFIVVSGEYNWILMLVLVLYIGTSHPPTANDRAPLGVGRYVLGLCSLAIPVLCFAPVPFRLE